MVPDIEEDVFHIVAELLSDSYPGISVYSEYVHSPESFPSVSIVESDSSTVLSAMDTEGSHHAQLMYDVNVYSNLASGRKAQAKEIMWVIDEKMQQLGFVRLGKAPVTLPNAESTIYRMESRYRTTVNENKQLLRR